MSLRTQDKTESEQDYFLTRENMPMIRKMSEKMPGGFFVYRDNERQDLIFANHIVLDIFGCDTLEEFKALTGYTFRGMVHPEDYVAIQMSIDEQIAGSSTDKLDYVVYRIIRKDDEVRWIADYGHFAHSKDFGDVYYVFISDITEKHNADEELAIRSEIVDGLGAGFEAICTLDLDTGLMKPYQMTNKYVQSAYQDLSGGKQRPVEWASFLSIYAEWQVAADEREFFLREARLESIRERIRENPFYSVEYRTPGGEVADDMYMYVARVQNDKFRNHAIISIQKTAGR